MDITFVLLVAMMVNGQEQTYVDDFDMSYQDCVYAMKHWEVPEEAVSNFGNQVFMLECIKETLS